MKFLSAFFLSVLTAVAADGPKQSIEKLDPALDALLEPEPGCPAWLWEDARRRLPHCFLGGPCH